MLSPESEGATKNARPVTKSSDISLIQNLRGCLQINPLHNYLDFLIFGEVK